MDNGSYSILSPPSSVGWGVLPSFLPSFLLEGEAILHLLQLLLRVHLPTGLRAGLGSVVPDHRPVPHAWGGVLPYPPDLGPHPTGPKRRRRAYGPCGRQAGGGRGEALLKTA